TERGTLAPDECVLVLASFREKYREDYWAKCLLPGLDFQQKMLRKQRNKPEDGAKYGIARSVDLDSPRLVSHAIYSCVRRSALCVADWTDWRPNVFFELGVRLASSKDRTVCLIEKGHRDACAEVTRDPGLAAREVERLGLGGPGGGAA